MTIEYPGSKKEALNHHTGSIGTLLMVHELITEGLYPEEIDFEKEREKYVQALKEALNSPDYGPIDQTALTLIIDRAGQTDWSNSDELLNLITFIDELRGPQNFTSVPM